MITVRTYIPLLVAVLCLVGCGQDRSNPDANGASPSSSAPSAAAPASSDTTGAARSGASSNGTASGTTLAEAPESATRVLVLGNSIAAGYGLQSKTQAFPALVERKAKSRGYDVVVQNAGLSGETTAGGLRRVTWLLQNNPVDVLILELGGNDGLRGVDLASTRKNLRAIIDTTLATYPDARVLLAGMQLPPNLGPQYTKDFRELYPEIAASYERVRLIPFILEGVGGNEQLMQGDGIHPTAEGQQRVAENVWEKLQPMLEEMRAETS